MKFRVLSFSSIEQNQHGANNELQKHQTIFTTLEEGRPACNSQRVLDRIPGRFSLVTGQSGIVELGLWNAT